MGQGYDLLLLASQPTLTHVMGVDIAPLAVDQCRTVLQSQGHAETVQKIQVACLDFFTFVPEEPIVLKEEKILRKLKNDTTPGPAGLRNIHVRMWMGALFSPATTETTSEHLEDPITDMANDRLPPWFMKAMQGADLLAIIKTERSKNSIGDHKPVVIPNTIDKITDKAMLHECQEDYMAKLLPHQLGVGVNFAAELLAMGIRMTLYIKGDRILISIDLRNAYNAMWRAAVVERHGGHMTLRRALPNKRAKLGPRAPIWAEEETIWETMDYNMGLPLQLRLSLLL
jgi:hypothetical protein